MFVRSIFYFLLLCSLLPLSVQADDRLPTQLKFLFAYDETDTHRIGVGLNQSLPQDYSLAADVEHITLKRDGETLNLARYHAAFVDASPQLFNAGFGVEHWGNSQHIRAETLYGVLDVTRPRFVFSLRPSLRLLKVFDASFGSFATASRGLKSSLRWFFSEDVSVEVSAAVRDYDDDPGVINQSPALRALVFSPLILQHAQGFDRTRFGAGLGYHAQLVDVFVDLQQSRSAIDRSKFTYAGIKLVAHIHTVWQLQTTLGQSLDGEASDQLFASFQIARQF